MNHLHEIAIIPTESISTKKHITLYATLDKDVNKFTAGREAVTSVAQPAPARDANKNIGNKKTPSRKASKPEYGKRRKIKLFTSMVIKSDILPVGIGILGKRTIKIESNPIKVKTSAEATIEITIKTAGRIKLRLVRNLKTATETPKNITGRIVYRPNRTANSVKKSNTDLEKCPSKGTTIAGRIAGSF